MIKSNCLILIFLIIICFNTSFGQDSKPTRLFKNLGGLINSNKDEYLPVIFHDTLYFNRAIEKDKNEIFFIDIRNIVCPSTFNNNLISIKLYNLKNIKTDNILFNPSTPTFYNFSKEDVYSNNLEKSIKEEVLNSDYNDLHPTISTDGQVIVFASDRHGDHNNTDLFVSIRKNDGSWSEPKPLSNKLNGINTPENEITPYLAPDGSLYYASKGFPNNKTEYYFSATEANSKRNSEIYRTNAKKNYNIIRAEPVPGNRGNWMNPKLLPFPINTNWDEIGPAIIIDRLKKDTLIYFASNRPSNPIWGDCFGGFDLFGYCLEKCVNCNDSCQNVTVTGYVTVECENINDYKGRIKVYRGRINESNKISEFFVSNSGRFSYKVPLPYDDIFFFEYIHPCLDERMIRTKYITCDIVNLVDCNNCDIKQRKELFYDLDTFSLGNPCCCKPVKLRVQLGCYNKKKKTIQYEVYDQDMVLLDDGYVSKTGEIITVVDYSQKYTIRAYIKCKNQNYFETIIIPKCNKNKQIEYNSFINIPLECCCVTDTFKFEKFEIPFFVTGFYFPTTKNNFEDLKIKLNTIFKNNDSIKYIDTSDYEYEKTFDKVQNGLDEAINFLKSKINSDACSCNLIEVKIEGLSDPRLLKGGKYAKYLENIDFDSEIEILNDIKIDRGMIMTNELLSILRAYNTAKYLKSKLNKLINDPDVTEVKWKIEGKGVDNSNKSFDLRRSINIIIKCLQ